MLLANSPMNPAKPSSRKSKQQLVEEKQKATNALALLKNALQPPTIQQLAAAGSWESYAQLQQAYQDLANYIK